LAAHPLLIRTQATVAAIDKCQSHFSTESDSHVGLLWGCEVLSAAIGATTNRAEADQYAAPFEADPGWTHAPFRTGTFERN